MRSVLLSLAVVAGLGSPAWALTPIEADALNPTAEGMFLVLQIGSSQSIPFGTAQGETVKTASKLWGAVVESGTMEECGAGPVDFASFDNGIGLHFQDGSFVGWAINRPGNAAVAPGLYGYGTPRAELATLVNGLDVFESSLGTEFSIEDAIFGVLTGPDENDTIASVWAGVSCNFR